MLGITLHDNAPIHEQLKNQIEKLILSDVLEKDSALPSVRELACDLMINPNTVQKAYSALELEGITYSVNGKGRFVAVSSNELKAGKTKLVFSRLDETVKELMDYGILSDEIILIIKQIYEKGGSRND